MILEAGCKTLVVHRRLFEGDLPRYFIGTVDHSEDGLARIVGNSWVQDHFNGKFVKKADARTKIVALSSLGLMVYVLPNNIQVANLRLDQEGATLWLRDEENDFQMDLSEMVHAK